MLPLEFIAGRQPALTTRTQDAVGVCMAPTRVIALGKQQDVLAERRQQFAAEGTVVGGGLAVVRPPRLPPARTVFGGHSSRYARDDGCPPRRGARRPQPVGDSERLDRKS